MGELYFMVNQSEVDYVVFQYLVHNQFHFKEAAKVYKERKDELLGKTDSCFHEELVLQYHDLVRQMLLDAITKQFALPSENVMIILEKLNVDEYV